MGYVLVMGHCILCQEIFTFNPVSVPSIRVDGERRPVCRACIENRVNPYRKEQGLEPVDLLPDAYEAVDESALGDD